MAFDMACQVCGRPVYGDLCDQCRHKAKTFDLLVEHVDKFFAILDVTEDSEMSGKEFHPVTIRCIRAITLKPLEEAMKAA